jgi:hypothetical protein
MDLKSKSKSKPIRHLCDGNQLPKPLNDPYVRPPRILQEITGVSRITKGWRQCAMFIELLSHTYSDLTDTPMRA